ncbi:MAG: hypothetical protein LBQ31_10205 [Bacteroidales bacterium]|jgi:hypothetical protein|nr:hypothetical protein [Bacteroidales bacterium]
MKQYFKIILLCVIVCFLLGCYDAPRAKVIGVVIYYPEIDATQNPEQRFMHIRTEKNNMLHILDTLRSTAYSSIDVMTSVDFEKSSNNPNYIICLLNTKYRDTISDIIVDTEKEKVVSYRLNGTLRTETTIEIR